MADCYSKRNGENMEALTRNLFWPLTVAATVSIGAVIGSLMTGIMAERLGRRGGLLLNGIINVFGGLFFFLAKLTGVPELLMAGRAVMGFNVGVVSGLAPLYLTEIAPVSVRGAVGTTHQVASAFGDWFCMALSLPQVLGGEELWPLALAFPSLTALILVCILPFCPESPRYLLVHKADKEGAYASALALTGNPADARALLDSIQDEVNATLPTGDSSSTLLDWFRLPELRIPAMLVIAAMVAQIGTGITVVQFYSTEILEKTRLENGAPALASVGVAMVCFISTIPALWLIERLGRRSLSLIQLNGCALCLIAFSVFMAVDEPWASQANIGILAIYMIFYGVGSSIPWLIGSELFSQEYRSTAVCIGTVTTYGLDIIVSSLYPSFKATVGPAWSFAPFIAVLLLSMGFLAAYLPETSGKPVDEIVALFRRQKHQYKKWWDATDSKATSDDFWLTEDDNS